MRELRIVSADSAAAILDAKFKPVSLVAFASVLVNPPYREACTRLAEAFLRKWQTGTK